MRLILAKLETIYIDHIKTKRPDIHPAFHSLFSIH